MKGSSFHIPKNNGLDTVTEKKSADEIPSGSWHRVRWAPNH